MVIHVGTPEWQVGEEGFLGGALPLHEVDRLCHQLIVNLGPDRWGIWFDVAKLAARHPFDDVRARAQAVLGAAPGSSA